MGKYDGFFGLMLLAGGAVLLLGPLRPKLEELLNPPKPYTPPIVTTPPKPGYTVSPYTPPSPITIPPKPEDTTAPIPNVPVNWQNKDIYHLAKLSCSNTKLHSRAELEAMGIKILHYQTSPSDMISCQACGICLHSYVVVVTQDAASVNKLLSLGYKRGRTIVIPPPAPIPQPKPVYYHAIKMHCTSTTLPTKTQLESAGVKLLSYQTSPPQMITCQACGVCLHSYILVSIDNLDSSSKTKLESMGFKRGADIKVPPPTPPPQTPPGAREYEFAAVGDWDVLPATAKTVQLLAAHNYPMILGLGDYPYGGDTPQQFSSIVAPIRSKLTLVRGNHEDASWIRQVNGQQSTVMAFNRGNIAFIICDSETGDNSHAEAAAKAAQENPAIDWIIPAIHRPTTPYSDVSTGGDIPGRSRALIPVWERYDKTRLVLSGHWHNYQRSSQIKGNTVVPKGVTYMVVGTAGARLYAPRGKGPYTAKQITGQYGYLAVHATDNELHCEFHVHPNGAVADEFTITK